MPFFSVVLKMWSRKSDEKVKKKALTILPAIHTYVSMQNSKTKLGCATINLAEFEFEFCFWRMCAIHEVKPY